MIAFHAGHDLLLANADGTGKRTLGTFREEPDYPIWSPDGSRIRFTLNDAEQGTQAIWEMRPDGSALRRIDIGAGELKSVCCGAWTPDGRYFIFADTDTDAPRLWALRERGSWWRRNPRGPFPLISEPTGSLSPLVGRDGKHVYFYRPELQLDMQRLDVVTGNFSAFLPGVRPVMSSFSRDGQWIAYVDLNTGTLCRSRTNGQNLGETPIAGTKIGFPRWSPDGRKLAFTGQPSGKPQNVYVMPAEGGRPEPVALGVDGISNPDWGPDGLTLVVERNFSSAQTKETKSMLEFLDLKNHEFKRIPNSENLRLARWSPDGRFLEAVGGDGGDLRIYDVATSTWRSVAHGHLFAMPAWSADGAYLYYQDVLSGGEPLFRLNIASGKLEKIIDFQKVLDSGVHRATLETVATDGSPVIAFHRGSGDIYGTELSLP